MWESKFGQIFPNAYHVVEVDEGVIDCNNVDLVLQSGTQHKASDTAEAAGNDQNNQCSHIHKQHKNTSLLYPTYIHVV